VFPDLGSFQRSAVDLRQAGSVAVLLAGRDKAGLDALVRAQANPASPQFRRFLTPAAYAARFGTDPAITRQLTGWLTDGGLQVDLVNAAGTFVHAHGTLDQISRRFNVKLARFTGMGQDFYAPTNAASVPAGLGVLAVTGLETRTIGHRHAGTNASVPIGAITTAQDLWSIYDQPASDTGQGQALAVLADGVDTGVLADLRQFEAEYNLPQMPFEIRHAGPTGTDNGRTEWNIDTQASSGMAPDARKLTMYFGTSLATDDMAAALQMWVDDPQGALQISGSYGGCEVFDWFDGGMLTYDAVLEQAVAQGRTAFFSTGDTGSGCAIGTGLLNGVLISPIAMQEYPASSPFAVAVGGTVVSTDGQTPPHRDLEYAWTHGGGGTSYFEPRPAYQDGVAAINGTCLSDPETNIGLGVLVPCRGVPDVAAQSADITSGYQIVSNGQDSFGAGTSLSAPLVQGMWARVNAAAPLAADGTAAGLGFANNVFYALGKNAASYSAAFYDVTVGANGAYRATAGWDYTTGWGVPDVTQMALLAAGGTTPTDPTAAHLPTFGSNVVPLPPCPNAGALTDPTGDATDFTGTQPSGANTDLTAMHFAWNGSALTAVIAIANFDDTLPNSSLGHDDVVTFVVDNVQYALSYNHDRARVDFGDPTASTTSETRTGLLTRGITDLGLVPYTLDLSAHTISITLTPARLAQLDPGSKPLTAASVISGELVETRENVETGYYVTDDAFLSGCQVTVGALPIT
jgi:subtilase family serine protease